MKNKTNFEWAEMFQEQIQNGASQSDIVQMLEEYKNQVLRIHDVVGQMEQLNAFVEWTQNPNRCVFIGRSKLWWYKHKTFTTEELYKEYLKEKHE